MEQCVVPACAMILTAHHARTRFDPSRRREGDANNQHTTQEQSTVSNGHRGLCCTLRWTLLSSHRSTIAQGYHLLLMRRHALHVSAGEIVVSANLALLIADEQLSLARVQAYGRQLTLRQTAIHARQMAGQRIVHLDVIAIGRELQTTTRHTRNSEKTEETQPSRMQACARFLSLLVLTMVMVKGEYMAVRMGSSCFRFKNGPPSCS